MSGLSQLSATQTITVSLISKSGHLLASVPAVVDDINTWRAILQVPTAVSGPADLLASVVDESGQPISSDKVVIQLLLGEDPGENYLTLSRPQYGDPAVNGYNILFDGTAQNPVNNLVTVSLWSDSCQEQVSSQNFRLDGSGEWWGLLYVPNNIQGIVCATAHFGTPGEQDWREAQTVIDVIAPDGSDAQITSIALPREGDVIPPGSSVEIKGLAYNAPQGVVTVALLLDNGRLLNEGVAAVDPFGYWELSLFIPAPTEGFAHIIAASGMEGSDNYSEAVTTIEISR